MTFRQQIIFWLVVLIMLSLFFSTGSEDFAESFYFVCMLLPVAIGTAWFFNDILVPKYLFRNRWLSFALYFIYLIIISLWLQMLVLMGALIVLANYQVNEMNPLTTNLRFLAISVYMVVLLQSFIHLFLQLRDKRVRLDQLEQEEKKQLEGYLTIKVERRKQRIPFDQILYIESLSDYVKINLSNGRTIITRETISRLADRLPKLFLRIHRSFLVNHTKITGYDHESVQIDLIKLPVSRKYKNNVTLNLDAALSR